MESKVILLILIIIGMFVLLRVIRGEVRHRATNQQPGSVTIPDAVGGRFG